MCCCSQKVISVTSTNIFARTAPEGRQFLVYSMSINADRDLSMVLPLPVKQPAGVKDVQFIDLKGYPEFFGDLDAGFPKPVEHASSRGLTFNAALDSASKLEVVPVGDFEASFVPTVKDFSRLDERFRLPEGTWDELPDYQTYGFAVFKLKPGAMTIHPMAFSFLPRNPHSLFFPTVHIHDGKVHRTAHFDHALYCQPTDEARPEVVDWKESPNHPSSFMRVGETKGIVLPNQHCYKKEMRGRYSNRDTLLKIHS
jgi:hypothetical protein